MTNLREGPHNLELGQHIIPLLLDPRDLPLDQLIGLQACVPYLVLHLRIDLCDRVHGLGGRGLDSG